MNNNLTETYDAYEICDIPDEIENTIDTFDNDDKIIHYIVVYALVIASVLAIFTQGFCL